ncbi:MAG: xylulose kinase [Spirochaetaceae bacterium]|nr:MAG: xylulose kinase [Spirochaetaceae bacterium]
MSRTYVLGVDIGTQGTKAVLCTERGDVVAEAFRASRLIETEPGAITEDPDDQFTATCETIAECIKKAGAGPRDVACLAIDGQMAGVIGIGADGRHVTPYDSWLDTRCGRFIEVMTDRVGDAVLMSTGNEPSFNHGPKILWWKSEHPDVFARIHSFVQPGAYAAMRLCGLSGNDAFIDTTYLHFSGFADTAAGTWNEELCRAFELDPGKLPSIVGPEEIVGRVTTEAARLTGLAEGTPVAAGCGDTAASFLSCGAVEPGICVDVAGTASVFSVTSDGFMPDAASRTLGCSRAVTPGLWHHYAYINGGGMNLEWFRKTIASVEPGALDVAGFDGLNELATAIRPAQSDPFFIPHVAGRVTPAAPNLRGAWVNLSWSHTIGHLYRAVLEAVALEYGIYLDAIRRLDPAFAFREMRVTGGGAKSALWNSIKADVAQTPVTLIGTGGGGPYGSAMLAAYAAGLAADVREVAKTWVTTEPGVDPNPEMKSHYRSRGRRYESFLEALSAASPGENEGAESDR